MNSKLFTILVFFALLVPISYGQDTSYVYLNKNYKVTTKENAEIFRRIVSLNHKYFVTDKTNTGELINYCEYKSLKPLLEDGAARHYSKTGELYASGNYSNGYITGEWVYFKDNKTDTVNYSVKNRFNDSQDCPDVKKIIYKYNALFEKDKHINAINAFVKEHFHYPARTMQKSIKSKVALEFILNTDGKILCPKVLNTLDDDLSDEVLRILALYVAKGKVLDPLLITYEFNSPVIANDDIDSTFLGDVQMPKFSYGNCENDYTCFLKFLSDNIKRPANTCSGKVIVQFFVEKDGSIVELEVLSGINNCPGYFEEIQRVINISPKWTPGYQGNKPVRIRITLPVNFKAKK